MRVVIEYPLPAEHVDLFLISVTGLLRKPYRVFKKKWIYQKCYQKI